MHSHRSIGRGPAGRALSIVGLLAALVGCHGGGQNGDGLAGDGGMGLVLPYTAVVQGNGGERAMLTPQRSGDCNTCYSQNGREGAPGRVMAP